MPGARLLRIAERLFDRATLDRVIVPAIADLQHECEGRASGEFAGALIRARAYWAVLQTVALCAVRDVASDRDGVSRSVAGRMLFFVPLLVALGALPGNAWLVSFGAKFGAGLAIEAGSLLLLSNLVLALPAAFYFAVALHRRTSRLDVVSVAAVAAACVAVMAALMMVIVPQTNQSYRLIVVGALSEDASLPRPVNLPKGLTEMTLSELNDQIAHPPSRSQEARARRHRQERFAYTAAPPVMGFVAFALARRRRSRALTLGIAVTLLPFYYAAFNNDLLASVGADTYRAWAPNALFVLIGLALFRAAAPTPTPEMEL